MFLVTLACLISKQAIVLSYSLKHFRCESERYLESIQVEVLLHTETESLLLNVYIPLGDLQKTQSPQVLDTNLNDVYYAHSGRGSHPF